MSADPVFIEEPARVSDRPIELAREQPFRLGDVTIVPRSRELKAPDGARRTLEPRVMQVLVALARARGATVGRDELIRTCWNGTVVGEDAINRTISVLRKIAEDLGDAAFRIETIPKLGYRLIEPGSEPDSLAGERNAPAARGFLAKPRVLAAAALTALVLAIGGIGLSWRTAPDGPAYSVNVQPFRVSGAAHGFDEQLLSTLTSQNVPTAAGRTRLTLTGAIEERGGTIRVDARLADTARGEVVWSGAIVLPPGEPGGLARAAQIVGSVAQCTIAGANDGDGTVPLDILSRYARTCELGYRGQPTQGVRVARELTRRASDFAPGWFALSYHAATLYFREPREDPALRAEALAAAERLIALRPNAQEGYTSKVLAMDPASIGERERLLLRATRLEPIYADVAEGYLGEFLLQSGRFEEAFQLAQARARQKPDLPDAQGSLFHAAAATGRWPVAEQALERVRQLDAPMVPRLLWRKAVWTGEWAEAERTMPFEHPDQQEAGIAAYRALALGDRARMKEAALQIMALPSACCLRLRIEILTQLGERTDAIALLDRFDAADMPATRRGLQFLWDPTLRPLWFDPALEPYLRRNGWIAYWKQGGGKPDVCNDAAPPPFCRPAAG